MAHGKQTKSHLISDFGISSLLTETCALSIFFWGSCMGPDDESNELELEPLFKLDLPAIWLSNSAYKGARVASTCDASSWAILPSEGVT